MIVIPDVKFDSTYDQILQDPRKDSSTSSKYECVLDAFIIMLGSWNFEYNSGMMNYVDSWCQLLYHRWSNPPKLQSGTNKVLQVWLSLKWTFNHDRELKIDILLNNDILWLYVMSNLIPNMTQSSKTSVKNHQCPPSMTVFLMHL